jgi:Na+-transporting NADH:ubiquinone oxidoreductase subunit C
MSAAESAAARLESPRYTLLFATAVCVVCSLLVAGSNVLLKDRQDVNRLLYLRKNILQASGLTAPGQRLPADEALRLFGERVESRLVDLQTGEYVTDVDPEAYDQRRARDDPARSRALPANVAQIRRVPRVAKVYLVREGERYSQVVIPVEGLGLYGTLYGFLALDRDTTTVRGIAFYENRETPGLGGEVDNPEWKALWPGRRAFDDGWTPRIELVKGKAGPPAESPHAVDALSGATLTSNGVTRMLRFWLDEQGFGPYLRRVREQGGP